MNLKSGYPFSLIKNGLPYDYPPLQNSATTDVAVIGGGISGALVSYYLIKKGISCTLLEGRTIGLGSTCASTSLLQYELDEPLTKLIKVRGFAHAVRAYQLGKEAISKLGSLAKELEISDFQFKPSLFYAASPNDKRWLFEEFQARQQNGFDVRWLEQKEIASEFNFNSRGAILSNEGAQTNAYLFTHALLQKGLKKGLLVFDRTFVSSVEHHKRKVVLTAENGVKVQAKYVIYAVGYEVVRYIKKRIVKLYSTYATASENIPYAGQFWKDNMMIWNTDEPYLYLRITNDNRIIIGGRDDAFRNAARRDSNITKRANKLASDFHRLFPKIPFNPEFNWTGTFGSTEDSLPFIGEYDKVKNRYFILGFGGNGMTFSLIAAEIITDLILGKKNDDARLFSFDRF